ncbi:MAG TPA: hypothetical protein VKG45_03960 [Actinomycetes bacterium]|nr:hypothetical protein [Actinomycetes bacterium]
MGVFDYEASSEEYERRRERRDTTRRPEPGAVFDQTAEDPDQAPAEPVAPPGGRPAAEADPPAGRRPPARYPSDRRPSDRRPSDVHPPDRYSRERYPPDRYRPDRYPASGRGPQPREARPTAPGPARPSRPREPARPAASAPSRPAEHPAAGASTRPPAPDAGLEQLARAADREGWAVAVQRRRDVEAALGRPLTGAEWQRVRTSRWWNDAVPDAMRQAAGELLSTMLASLGLVRDEQDGR